MKKVLIGICVFVNVAFSQEKKYPFINYQDNKIIHGKDSSGKYVWTDIFVLRNGRWQVVASQSTRMQ